MADEDKPDSSKDGITVGGLVRGLYMFFAVVIPVLILTFLVLPLSGLITREWDTFAIALLAGVAGMLSLVSLVLAGVIVFFARWRKVNLRALWLLMPVAAILASGALWVATILVAGGRFF